jgi:hypothetical protein
MSSIDKTLVALFVLSSPQVDESTSMGPAWSVSSEALRGEVGTDGHDWIWAAVISWVGRDC